MGEFSAQPIASSETLEPCMVSLISLRTKCLISYHHSASLSRNQTDNRRVRVYKHARMRGR